MFVAGITGLIYPFQRLHRGSRRRAAAIALCGLIVALGVARWSTPQARGSGESTSGIDTFAPSYHFREQHAIEVSAPASRVFDAVKATTADEIALFNLFTWIRRFGRAGPESILNAPGGQPLLDVAVRSGFILLQDRPPHEVIIGAIVVAPPGARRPASFTATDFKELAAPGLWTCCDEFSSRGHRRRGFEGLYRDARLRDRQRGARTIHAVLANHFSWQFHPSRDLVEGHQDARGKDRLVRRMCMTMLAAALMMLQAAPAAAHPAPFSYLDLHLDASGVSGTLVVHDLDAAHDLGIANADTLLEPAVAARYRDALVALLGPRINLMFDGQPAGITWGAIDVVPDRQSVRLAFTVSSVGPGHIGVHAYVFPYDPIHQTFINIYEDSALKMQAILDASHQDMSVLRGQHAGAMGGRQDVRALRHRTHHDRPGSHPVPDRIVAPRRHAVSARADRDLVHHRPQHHLVTGRSRYPFSISAIHRAVDRPHDRRRRRRQLARPLDRKVTLRLLRPWDPKLICGRGSPSPSV